MTGKIAAIVLAAGLSTRMRHETGVPKVLLDWNGKTIIEHIVGQLRAAEADPVIVVTGNHADLVRARVEPLGAVAAYNADYARGEMLSSIKTGLRALPEDVTAALIALGDQPRIQADIVRQVISAYREEECVIAAPSYNRRRGHPILIDRQLWDEILALPEDGSLRTVINAHQERIAYVVVEDDAVLHDVDTPADYLEEQQRAGLTPPEA